jgi:hypothetical protein
VPFFEAYGGKLEKGALGLYAAPRVEAYRGLIFASWDAGAEPLVDFLGPMTWIMDFLFARSEAVVAVGPPMRWVVDANWKLGAGNFGGDGHHVPVTHGFATALGLEPKREERYAIRTERGRIYTLPAAHGHAAHLKFAAGEPVAHPYLGLPEALWPEIARSLPPAQYETMRALMTTGGNLFPNLSYLHFLNAAESPITAGRNGTERHAISFLTLRQWQPRGADHMEVWSWLFVDAGAPVWWREASRECYLRGFGTAGIFEQDDAENWAEITQALQGPVARRLWLQYKMGLGLTPAEDWPGPGTAYLEPGYMELNEREFYRYWAELMERA